MHSRIAGTGKYLPERVLTNFELEKMVDTSDEWIRSRTGIERRHIASDEQATSDLAYLAARAAIEDAGVEPGEIDLIIVGTTTPDLITLPSSRRSSEFPERRLSASKRPAVAFSMRSP